MTAKTTVVLTDSSQTPESPGTPASVDRTFTPGAVENGYVHTFYEGTTGTTPDTKSKLTMSLVPATSTSPQRVRCQLSLPKAQTVDGVVKRAHVNRGFFEFVFDKDSTRDDRRDTKFLLYEALASAEIDGMVSNGEDLY